jgi:hypothetical protein
MRGYGLSNLVVSLSNHGNGGLQPGPSYARVFGLALLFALSGSGASFMA